MPDVYSDAIRAALDALGLSQRAAAKLLDVPERDFRGWCAGKEAPVAVLYALLYLTLVKEDGWLLETLTLAHADCYDAEKNSLSFGVQGVIGKVAMAREYVGEAMDLLKSRQQLGKTDAPGK